MKFLLFLLLCLTCNAQPAFPSSLFSAPKLSTNTFRLTWDRPIGYVIFSNRVSRITPYSTNRWWVSDVTQSVFSIVRTNGEPRWSVTVAALGLELSGESSPAYWPPFGPTNLVVQLCAVLATNNCLPLVIRTNPTDNLFLRLRFQPTNSTFTTPMWFPETSPDLFRWTNIPGVIVAPQFPKLELTTTNWRY